MAQRKILIVDDEKGIRDMLADLLYDMDCELIFAEDGIKALDAAIEAKPDIILLDIMLPGMDGFEVCKQLRQHPEAGSIPVIMITGHNTEDSAKKGIEVGADDVLAKPFNMSELKLRIKTILRLNRYRIIAGEREQFQWVVENAQAAYIFLKPDDVCTYLNPSACRFFNLSEYRYPEDTLKFLDLVGDGFECVPDGAWEQWPNVEECLYLVRPESSEQKPLWLKLEVVPSHMIDRRMLRITDVTEDMLMFHNMWQFEHMVSHKLRTPLMGVMGSLDGLESKSAELGEHAGLVDEAQHAVQRLNQSIQGILDHLSSRNSESRGVSTPGKIDAYIRQLAITYGLDEPNVEIAPEVQMRELRMTNEDLLQLLQELVENSVKFHPSEKPALEVRVLAADKELTKLIYMDDGVRVDADSLTQIGKPFYQAEKHFTGEVPGMGLGLSMISGMLTTRGGQCRLYNRNDKAGFVVELSIPRGESHEIL